MALLWLIPESSSESAKDALRQVLNRAGDTLEIGDNFSFYDNTEKHADPLMNMEIYQSTGFNGLTRRASSLGIIEDGIHSRTEKSQGLDFQRKQSLQNHSTKSSELLDYILNTDSHPVVALHRPNSHSTSLQPSAVSISEIQVIAESPDLCGTNEKQESVELQTSSSLIMTDSQVNSADSGLSSSPPPLQSVNFLTFSPKKLTHHRSVSDHGVLQKVMVVKPPARMAHSPPNDMSSSLPANSYKNGKPPGKHRTNLTSPHWVNIHCNHKSGNYIFYITKKSFKAQTWKKRNGKCNWASCSVTMSQCLTVLRPYCLIMKEQ